MVRLERCFVAGKDVSPLPGLRILEQAEHAVDVLLVAFAHIMHIGMDCRHRPLLALGIHAQGDHGAGGKG